MRDELSAALARDDLSLSTRAQIEGLQGVLSRDSQAHLDTFSIVAGRAHAVVSFGDTENADLVILLLHGVETDLGAFPAWADAAQRLCADVIRTTVARGTPRTVATIAWFAWDAGTHATATATTRATLGAAQLSVELDRIAARAPRAHLAVVTYSYSTTLLGEMFALRLADRIDTAVSIASAGVTAAASVAIEEAIRDGDVVVHATEAAADAIAPLGRMGAHPVDPRDIAGVRVYDSDGGAAPGTDGGVVPGLPVDGHASQTWIDEFGTRHVGYYDGAAQGYLSLVGILADAVRGAS